MTRSEVIEHLLSEGYDYQTALKMSEEWRGGTPYEE